jgi:Na+/proline symporter
MHPTKTPEALKLISGLVCIVLGILGAVLFIGLATDGHTRSDDLAFVGVLTGIFLATGALLVYLDWRQHGRRPQLLAILAGVLVGVLCVIVAAITLVDHDVQLDAGSGGKRLAKAIAFGAGIMPGVAVYYLVRRFTRRSATPGT